MGPKAAAALILVVMLVGCTGLTSEEEARVGMLTAKIADLAKRQIEVVNTLKAKHAAGKLTTEELDLALTSSTREVAATISEAKKELEEITAAARNRGVGWLEYIGSLLGSILVAGVGLKSPGGAALLAKLFGKQPAPTKKKAA